MLNKKKKKTNKQKKKKNEKKPTRTTEGLKIKASKSCKYLSQNTIFVRIIKGYKLTADSSIYVN